MAHRSRLSGFVIDVRTDDLAGAAAFWSAALGLPATLDGNGRYAHFRTPAGEPVLDLQAVEHESRIHLDIETDDKAAEVARLEALGARVVAQKASWTVMQAPTGHRFCVVDPHRADFADAAPRRG
jgi:predicted enzyme related to lactoylglutathione lyase